MSLLFHSSTLVVANAWGLEVGQETLPLAMYFLLQKIICNKNTLLQNNHYVSKIYAVYFKLYWVNRQCVFCLQRIILWEKASKLKVARSDFVYTFCPLNYYSYKKEASDMVTLKPTIRKKRHDILRAWYLPSSNQAFLHDSLLQIIMCGIIIIVSW